jgi:hypothetical protein
MILLIFTAFHVSLTEAARRSNLPAINSSVYFSLRDTLRTNLSLTNQYGILCLNCADAHKYGGIVRLAFHDAVGAPGNGANACLDYTTSDNDDIQDIQNMLDKALNSSKYKSLISRADFYVLAATLVIELTSTKASGFSSALFSTSSNPMDASAQPLVLPFVTGRVDDASCAGDGEFLPSTSYNWTQIAGLFTGRIGMTPREIVAIMGAHSLGGIHTAVKGNVSRIGWVQSATSFSNNYYSVLLNGTNGWFGERQIPSGFSPADMTQGTGNSDAWTMTVTEAGTGTGPGNPAVTGKIIMLRTDVELGVNTTSTYKPSQGPSFPNNVACGAFGLLMMPATTPPGQAYTEKQAASCPRRESNIASISLFAQNSSAWHASFKTAWEKLVNMGYSISDFCAVGDTSSACTGEPPGSVTSSSSSISRSATPSDTPTGPSTLSPGMSPYPSVSSTPTPTPTPTQTPPPLSNEISSSGTPSALGVGNKDSVASAANLLSPAAWAGVGVGSAVLLLLGVFAALALCKARKVSASHTVPPLSSSRVVTPLHIEQNQQRFSVRGLIPKLPH